MNEEKLKEILNKIGKENVPPNAALIAERVSQNFSAILKIQQPKHWFAPARLIAAAAVIIFAFSAGRWSGQMPSTFKSPEMAAYAQTISQVNPESFWQQKAIAAMKPRPYAQTSFNRKKLINTYKQYFKD
jgi:hypothetical protein